METIPSEAACFPAKLTHGHIQDLIERKVDAIFLPQELYGRIVSKQAVEHYRCAMLSTYGAMINNSFDFDKLGIKYFTPALPVYADEVCSQRFGDKVHTFWPDIKEKDAQSAYLEGCKAYNEWRDEVKKKGEETIAESRRRHQPIAVLAAYPYQYDGMHCGAITPMLLQEGYNVITADSIAHLGTDIIKPYQILNMHSTDSRIMDAAKYAANQEDFIFIYLSSFGCGVTPACNEQCQAFLRNMGRMYANIKIDQ
ncbi:MAG: putative 2-hydroxyglutaryl-CoA dehydratase, partial [Streblomastix strix]